MFYYYQGGWLFPYHPILDFYNFQTPLTAFYGCHYRLSLMIKGFSRKKYKFFGAWLIVFLIWTGVLYGTYGYALGKVSKLEGIKAMTVYAAEKNNTSWLIRIDEEALNNEKYRELIKIISEAEKGEKSFYPREKEGYELLVDFAGGGTIPIYLDKHSGTMIVSTGDTYQLSPENLEYITEVLGGEGND